MIQDINSDNSFEIQVGIHISAKPWIRGRLVPNHCVSASILSAWHFKHLRVLLRRNSGERFKRYCFGVCASFINANGALIKILSHALRVWLNVDDALYSCTHMCLAHMWHGNVVQYSVAPLTETPRLTASISAAISAWLMRPYSIMLAIRASSKTAFL